jgi:hypothetical protein
MSTKLFGRRWFVSVEGVDVSNLDIEFQIHKSLRPEPNTCRLKIYNLSQANRDRIEALNLYEPVKGQSGKRQSAEASAAKRGRAPKAGRIAVEVYAGYEGDLFRGKPPLLFRGDLRRAISTREGPDWVTEIEGEDGGRSILTARVAATLNRGTTVGQAVRMCADIMGVGIGNYLEFSEEMSRAFPTGAVLDGPAQRELSGILRRLGMQWSVQNGVLQFTKNGKTNDQRLAPALSSVSGMVGDPARNATGEVEATSLLIPGVYPGGYVMLQTQRYPGLYSVQVVDHIGSTFGNDWYHKIALTPAA